MAIFKTVELLAKHLGRSARQAATYLNDGLREACERPRGGFDGVKATAWLKDRLAKRQSNPMKERLARAKLRNLLEDRRAKELRRLTAEGELVRRDDVVAEFTEVLIYAQAILESVPDDATKEVPEAYRVTIHTICQHAVDRAFRQLACWTFKGD